MNVTMSSPDLSGSMCARRSMFRSPAIHFHNFEASCDVKGTHDARRAQSPPPLNMLKHTWPFVETTGISRIRQAQSFSTVSLREHKVFFSYSARTRAGCRISKACISSCQRCPKKRLAHKTVVVPEKCEYLRCFGNIATYTLQRRPNKHAKPKLKTRGARK